MTDRKELERLAKDFLRGVSDDESLIDATSTYVKNRLVDLLVKVHTSTGDGNEVADHAALGAWVGAFDE
jgi:hypothetical protein